MDCPGNADLPGDAQLLEQALASIAANAVQHMSHGTVSLRGRPTATSVVIEVADSGPGIARARPEKVFDRFYRGAGAKPATASGSACRSPGRAVRHLGGQIELDSEEGVGTTVRLTFPSPPSPGGRMSPRILVVDDEPSLVTTLTYALEREN